MAKYNQGHYFFPVEIFGATIEELQQSITIHFQSSPRIDVLKEIARQGNLGISLNANLPLLNNHLTIKLENATIAEGLTYALMGTDYDAAITRRREIVLVAKSVNPVSAASLSKDEQTQYGYIVGEVRDASSGETLPGANVIIKGTNIGVATDVDGRFTLRRVPTGNQLLEVRYLGFMTQDIPVTVIDNERITQNVFLEEEHIEGDEIFVVGRQRGQARALTSQRQSTNIRSVVSSEQMDRFADATVEGSLQRIAGMGHGGANIRGLGPAASNITMDGQRMGTTGAGDRSVDISTISADMVQELEVIKVITPDMDADALSGVININTRRPLGGERSLNVRMGGGASMRYIGQTGPEYRTSMSYGESPSDRFSYGFNLSFQREAPTTESVSTTWGVRTFHDTPTDVLASFSPQFSTSPRERFGTGLQMTFQPSDRTTFHVQSMFNVQNRDVNRYNKHYDPNIALYVRQDSAATGSGGIRSHLSYRADLHQDVTNQYMFQFGGRHLFTRSDLQYKLGWGHGRFNGDQYNWTFRSGGVADYMVDMSDRWYPTIGFTNTSIATAWPTADNIPYRGGGSIDHRTNSHVDNDFKGSIDLEVPFPLVKLKFGASTVMTFKNGTREDFDRNYNRSMKLSAFELNQNASWTVFDRSHDNYHIPWFLDLYKARDFYLSNIPNFDMDMESWALSAETNYYSANENIFATYGMATFKKGRWTVLGGLRAEHTYSRYDGRAGSIDELGTFAGAVDSKSLNEYTYLFPNAQFVYGLGRMTNIRMAYSRSIGRPSFSQLSSYVLVNHANQSISRGNPELEPMLSDNFDFLIEHYFLNVGQLMVGLYYKDLQDFVFSFTEFIRDSPDPAIEGYQLRSVRNGESAIAYGLEISWQQYLDFLPGFLSNLGIYSNYSYAQSKARIDNRTETVRLQDQRPHVVNAGLDYSQGGFSGQISYQWASPSLVSYGSQRLIPGIGNHDINTPVYFDRFRDAANDLSMTLRYRLTSNFRLWTDVSNIMNHRRVDYFVDRDVYPANMSLSSRTFTLGVRYSL